MNHMKYIACSMYTMFSSLQAIHMLIQREKNAVNSKYNSHTFHFYLLFIDCLVTPNTGYLLLIMYAIAVQMFFFYVFVCWRKNNMKNFSINWTPTRTRKKNTNTHRREKKELSGKSNTFITQWIGVLSVRTPSCVLCCKCSMSHCVSM